MQEILLGGLPKERNYHSLVHSNEFRELELFSDNFLAFHHNELREYTKKWVKDPLHQWSRQWEYPYVFSRVQQMTSGKENVSVLDAGSGVTFFPYFIKSKFGTAKIECVDYDDNLRIIYQKINTQSNQKVNFTCANLKELPYDDNQFDVIYCISVLEHTDDYPGIIEGFHRILRPGGRLIITFDVSLDGMRDISVEKGIILLRSLLEKYELAEDLPLDLKTSVLEPDIFTTLTAMKIAPSLLPWKLPAFAYRFKSLIKDKRLSTWPPPLSVFCLSLAKPVS